jgi:hypothetical protein
VLDDPAAPPDEVLDDPVLDEPAAPPDEALDAPVLDDPVLDDPVLDDPVLEDPVLEDPAVPPAEVLSVGLALVPPGAGELDARETGVEGVALTGVDAVAGALGLAVMDGVGVEQGVPVAVAGFLLPVALVLAFAEAVVVPLLVAVAVTLTVAVAVPVTVALALAPSLELTLPLAGLSLGPPLVLPPGGLVTGVAGAGVALGVTDLDGLAATDDEADDEEVDWQAASVPLLWPAEVRPRLAPPPDELAWAPDPATLAPPLALEEENPTAEPSWTKASRSGGTAKETPIANTAQATASAGRSSPYRQSRGCRPAPPVPAPPVPAASCPPRTAFQRCTRSARKPRCREAHECLLA